MDRGYIKDIITRKNGADTCNMAAAFGKILKYIKIPFFNVFSVLFMVLAHPIEAGGGSNYLHILFTTLALYTQDLK